MGGFSGAEEMKLIRFSTSGAAVAGASLALSSILPTQANAQSIQQEVINNVIQNILQNVRDQIQHRRVLPSPGMMRFSSEESDFDNRNPFATQNAGNPFEALAYAKAPSMAVAPIAAWLYGVNGVGSVDRTSTIFNDTKTVSATGAVDVTKIGIFTATDALTFIGTGSGAWSHTTGVAPWLDTTTSSGAGTLAYTNGGFSTDFTANASWTSNTLAGAGIFAPPDSSAISYTGNVQYKYDLAYAFWVEPTVGVTYTDTYTANFGTKIGDSTEVHGGARIGTEIKWMGFTVQPTLSGAVFKIVDQSPAVGPVLSDQLGGRGSGKLNIIWNNAFSTYIEAHGSGIAGTKTLGFVGTQTYGGSGGLRYTF